MKKKNTVTIHENMNRKKLVIDSTHANPMKNNMLKQLETLEKSFSEMSSLLSKASLKKMFLNNNNSVALQCSKKCMSFSQNAKKIHEDLDIKYNDDIKMSLINDLNERISYLESKILNK